MPQRSFKPSYDPNTLTETAFLHHLAAVPVVTVEEGLRAVLMLTDDGTDLTTYEQRYEALCRLGAIKPAWKLRPGRVLDQGTLAYMLRTICHLPKSLNETLADRTGWGDRRYALQSCIHAGLISYTTAHNAVRGGELLSALTASEQYLSQRPSEGS